MIVIRRMVDRQRAYTAIFLKGEPAQIFPTNDYEHGRILAIFKQDRSHEGIINDFTEFALGLNPVLPREPKLMASTVTEEKSPDFASVRPFPETPSAFWLVRA
jgi:hypothetical protein